MMTAGRLGAKGEGAQTRWPPPPTYPPPHPTPPHPPHPPPHPHPLPSRTFGATYTVNGALANMALGGRDFLIQQNCKNWCKGYI